jgi:hypothetical protein
VRHAPDEPGARAGSARVMSMVVPILSIKISFLRIKPQL